MEKRRIDPVSRHAVEIGIELIASEAGWAEFGLKWRDVLMAHANSDVPASAPIISLMESACARAVRTVLDPASTAVVLSLRVDHLRSATSGRKLIGRAECTRVTKRIAFASGVAHDGDEDDPVAAATASFFYTGAP